jgi:hypothetical protein
MKKKHRGGVYLEIEGGRVQEGKCDSTNKKGESRKTQQ